MRRKLKVYYQKENRQRRNLYNPRITLTGLWVQNLGFDIGDDIIVHCSEGRIIIEKEHQSSQI